MWGGYPEGFVAIFARDEFCVRMVGDSDDEEEAGCRQHCGSQSVRYVRAEFTVIPDCETS